jgi:HPt (histidine-containing phosphotransfer) domain-containing protein
MLERLTTVPGLDVSHGLAVVRGKAAKYLELLGRFVAMHAEDMARLTACLSSGDQITALRLVHNLKGAAATLGVKHLAELVMHLEEGLRTDTVMASGRSAIDEEMQAISSSSRSLRQRCPSPLPLPACRPSRSSG